LSCEEKLAELDPIFKTESNVCPSRCMLDETKRFAIDSSAGLPSISAVPGLHSAHPALTHATI
jgi:hypothetical protein